jgi:transposase
LPEEKRRGRLSKRKGNKPQFDLRRELFHMTGTDLTRIDGIDVMTVMTIRVTIALKMAAISLRASSSYLGAQFRRLRTRLGAPVAIKAMAAKLARLVYRMLRYGMQFVDQGAELYEAQHRKRQVRSLRSKALELGFRIIEVEAPAA